MVSVKPAAQDRPFPRQTERAEAILTPAGINKFKGCSDRPPATPQSFDT